MKIPKKISITIEKEIEPNTVETHQLILRKGQSESSLHVLLKLLAYIYFWDIENELIIEPRKFHRYRPDLISWRQPEIPTQVELVPDLWIECKHVKINKLIKLGREFSNSKIYWFHKFKYFERRKEELPQNVYLIGVEAASNVWDLLKDSLFFKGPYWRFTCDGKDPKTVQIRSNGTIGQIVFHMSSENE
ncbi:MAG: hypothetical protein ACFFCZ_18015 [Promethearchaeota archaeon]